MAASKRFALLITGVPGTGKTTAARLLCAKTGAALLEINKLAELLGLYSGVDRADNAKIVRLRELEREISRAVRAEKRSIVVEGHLGCEMGLPVSKVVVLRCEPKTLRSRLSSRAYSQEKISANALSEALDYCTVWSEKNYGKAKVFEIDTTRRTPGEVAEEIAKIASGRKAKRESVSFPDALLREAISGERIRKTLDG